MCIESDVKNATIIRVNSFRLRKKIVLYSVYHILKIM